MSNRSVGLAFPAQGRRNSCPPQLGVPSSRNLQGKGEAGADNDATVRPYGGWKCLANLYGTLRNLVTYSTSTVGAGKPIWERTSLNRLLS